MRTIPLRRLLRPREDANYPGLQVLSVYRDHGIVPKGSRSDNFNRTPLDLSRYLRVGPGDLVVNKMKAWSGSVAISTYEGIVSGDYLVCEVSPAINDRYLHHVLRSPHMIGEMGIRSRGIRPNQERLYWDELADIAVGVPSIDEQRRIADFLDDQVTRIENIIAARRQQISLGSARVERANLDMVVGISQNEDRRRTGLGWLEAVPESWPVLTVNMEFEVLLGKMLDERRITGDHLVPYLRNTNVQWGTITTDDVKSMDIRPDELDRFTVQEGDLLICEGGQPGRCAIWDGRRSLMGYQKALHRARSRGRSRPEWLAACLRAAVTMNVFAIENGQTTIGHLTNEQLRAQRFPFPPQRVQDELLTEDNALVIQEHAARTHLERSIALLAEYKQSLITAAVTGELDVTTASRRVPA